MKNKKMYFAIPILMLGIILGAFAAIAPVNSLTMDVNPSVEIVTSRLDRVVEINPLNEDARELLEGFDPKDKNLENTVNDLVDLMILTGHIKGGEDNFVLLTVEDETVDNKLVSRVNEAIAAILENKQIEATIMNQAIARDGSGAKQTGVELAAERFKEINDDLGIEEIGDMTVRELIYYSQKQNIPIENLFEIVLGNIKKPNGLKTIISEERAREIALNKINGEITKIELDDFSDDEPEYEIEIVGKDGKYELEIHGYTGEVLEFELDDSKEKTTSNKKVEKPTTPAKPTKPANNRITGEEARKIALNKVGGGKIVEFEADDDEYEIEIEYNGKEYEIEIHAYTGAILDFDVDSSDSGKVTSNKKTKTPTKPANNRITGEEARRIALNKVGGGKIVEFEADDDEYEIEIEYNGKEYEIEIHAYTGAILDFDVDDID